MRQCCQKKIIELFTDFILILGTHHLYLIELSEVNWGALFNSYFRKHPNLEILSLEIKIVTLWFIYHYLIYFFI